MAAVKALEARKNGAKVEAKVRFAGQQFSVERAKTETDIKQEQRINKNKLGGGCSGLDDIVATIGEKDKNVTSIEKSKMDWERHTKEQKLETELETNRKDGFLAKKRFIDSISEIEY